MNILRQMCFIWCIDSLFAQSHTFLSARVGCTALLPCDLKNISRIPVSIQTSYMEWCTISETVFERRGEESYQGERYKDRADVPHHMLLKGNCSLVLKEVRPDDAGVYESYLLVKQSKRVVHSERVFIQSVQLFVSGTTEEIDSQNVYATAKRNFMKLGAPSNTDRHHYHMGPVYQYSSSPLHPHSGSQDKRFTTRQSYVLRSQSTPESPQKDVGAVTNNTLFYSPI